MTTPLHVLPVPAFKDNYIWLMHNGRQAVVVDPGATDPVEKALDQMGLELSAIVLTHLHYDHCWGVPELLQHWPVPVYGPILNDHDRKTHPPFPRPGTMPLDCVTRPVGNGDRVVLHALHTDLTVIAVPGHTRGHLVYWDQARARVFTGDTLFGGGCGKVFGGSMSDMQESLDTLAHLPPQTEVYCAHEYTLSNLKFAMVVNPSNKALQSRYELESCKRKHGEPTLPSTIGRERDTNPFLRLSDPEVRESIRRYSGQETSTAAASFEALRNWKDSL